MDTGVSAEERQPASQKTSPGAALSPAWPPTHSSWVGGIDALPSLGSGLWCEDSGGHSGAGGTEVLSFSTPIGHCGNTARLA